MENGKKKYLDGDGARYLVQQMQKGVDVVRENVDFNNEILYGRTGVPKVYSIDDLVDEPVAAGIDVNSDNLEEDYITALVAALNKARGSDKVAVGDIVESNMYMELINAGLVTWATIFDCGPEDIPEGFPDNLPADAAEELIEMAEEAKYILSVTTYRFRRAGSGDDWTHGAVPDLYGWQILRGAAEGELSGLMGTVYDTFSRLSGIPSTIQNMVNRVPVREIGSVGDFYLYEQNPGGSDIIYSTTLECFLYQNGSGSGRPFADATLGDVGKLQEYTVTRPKLGYLYVGRGYIGSGSNSRGVTQIYVGRYDSTKNYNVLVPYSELPSTTSAKVEDLSTKVEDLISTMNLVNAAFEAQSEKVAALEARIAALESKSGGENIETDMA